MKRGARWVAVLGLAGVLFVAAPASSAHADVAGELMGGVGDIVGAAFSIPLGIIEGTLSGPPIVGTLSGAIGGAFNTLGLATRGVFRLVGVAIPIAATVAPYIPLFL